MRLLLFGPPGAGKGTQANLLSKEFHVPHISTGDMLRHAAASGTELGLKAKTLMDGGRLVPDDVMIAIVRDELSSPEARHGFILDGFPRTLPQAEALTHIFHDLGINDYRVVVIDLTDDEIVQRLGNRLICDRDGRIFTADADQVTVGSSCPSCGGTLRQRDDDDAAVVRERLRIYHASTAPVFHFYDRLGVVVKVNGMGTIEGVNGRIRQLLAAAAKV